MEVCSLWPALAGFALKLSLAGLAWEITVKEEGYETSVALRPIPVMVSDNPPKFARPTKI